MQKIPAGWVEVNAGNFFGFLAPAGTVRAPPDGVPFDSFVQQYKNPDFTIQFDYGYWSNPLNDFINNAKYSTEKVWIDDRPAIIVSGPGDGAWGCNQHMTAVYVVDRLKRGGRVALQMDACTPNPKNILLIHNVFKTIRFRYSPLTAWLHYLDNQ